MDGGSCFLTNTEHKHTKYKLERKQKETKNNLLRSNKRWRCLQCEGWGGVTSRSLFFCVVF